MVVAVTPLRTVRVCVVAVAVTALLFFAGEVRGVPYATLTHWDIDYNLDSRMTGVKAPRL